MSSISIPIYYQQVMPNLIVTSAEQFQTFVQKVFEATEKMKNNKLDNTKAHAEVQLGRSAIIFSNNTDAIGNQPSGFFVYVWAILMQRIKNHWIPPVPNS